MKHFYFKGLILIGFIFFSKIACAQSNFIDIKHLLDFSQPVYDKEGNLIIAVTLNKTADTTKYTIADFEFKQLIGTVSLRDRTISMKPIDPTGVGSSRRYVINREATGLDRNLKTSDFRTLNYKLFFSIRGADTSKGDEFKNIAFDEENGRLIVGEAVRRPGDDFFTLPVKATNDGVRIISDGSFVKRNKDDKSSIALLKKEVILKSKDEFTSAVLGLVDGNDIHQGDILYLNLHAIRDDKNYNLYEDERFRVRLSDPYSVTNVVNSTVTGNNEGKIIVSTSIPGKSLNLNFKENPLAVGNLRPISGIPEPGTNNFTFIIPSNSVDFKSNKYELVFSGESKNEQLLSIDPEKTFYFEKRKNECRDISIRQSKDEITITANLEDGNGKVFLTFLNRQVQNSPIVSMDKSGEKTFIKTFSCNDRVLTGAVDTAKKQISLGVTVEGVLSCMTTFDAISILYKKKAEEDLKAIASNFHKDKNKKKAIKDYLDKNGFVDSTADLAEKIVNETNKKPSTQDWSGIWQTAAKLVPVVVKGLFLLL